MKTLKGLVDEFLATELDPRDPHALIRWLMDAFIRAKKEHVELPSYAVVAGHIKAAHSGLPDIGYHEGPPNQTPHDLLFGNWVIALGIKALVGLEFMRDDLVWRFVVNARIYLDL